MQTEASGQDDGPRHPLDDGGAGSGLRGGLLPAGQLSWGYCWTKAPGPWLGDPWLGEMAGPVDGSSLSARYAERRANPYVSTWATNPGSECWTLSTSSATSAGRRTSSRTERVFHIGLRPFKSAGVSGGNGAGRGVTWHRTSARRLGGTIRCRAETHKDRGGWPPPIDGLGGEDMQLIVYQRLTRNTALRYTACFRRWRTACFALSEPAVRSPIRRFQVLFRHGVMECFATRGKGPSGCLKRLGNGCR